MLEHLPSTQTDEKASVRWGDDVRVTGLAEFFVQAMAMRGIPNSTRALAILCACHSSRTFSSVAEELNISKPATTRNAGLLCRAGLLRRSPDPADGRGVLMAATPKGRRLIGKLAAAFSQTRPKATNWLTGTHGDT